MSDTLNFCLTFEAGLSNVITALSRQLSLGLSTDYVLSPDSLPHVSVLKLNVPPMLADEVWQKLAPVLPSRINLRFEGLRLLPGKTSGVLMEISIASTVELRLLQEQARRQLEGYNLPATLGDSWRPHVTLLHSIDARLPASIPLDRNLLQANDIVATPVLGRNVASGMLAEILHRPKL